MPEFCLKDIKNKLINDELARIRTWDLLITSLVLYHLSYLAWWRVGLENLQGLGYENLMKYLISEFTGNPLNRFPFPGMIWDPDNLYEPLEASNVCKIILAYRVAFAQCVQPLNISKYNKRFSRFNVPEKSAKRPAIGIKMGNVPKM